jgi:hypothetical protein
MPLIPVEADTAEGRVADDNYPTTREAAYALFRYLTNAAATNTTFSNFGRRLLDPTAGDGYLLAWATEYYTQGGAQPEHISIANWFAMDIRLDRPCWKGFTGTWVRGDCFAYDWPTADVLANPPFTSSVFDAFLARVSEHVRSGKGRAAVFARSNCYAPAKRGHKILSGVWERPTHKLELTWRPRMKGLMVASENGSVQAAKGQDKFDYAWFLFGFSGGPEATTALDWLANPVKGRGGPEAEGRRVAHPRGVRTR